MSTVNFDPATSLTSNGAINIVTRSGGNDYHGSGFSFYRDHNLAAYPALRRDPSNPDPFFQRDQFGSYLGGPIRKDRAFFFASYERNDQRGVISVQPGTPISLHWAESFRVPISAICSVRAPTCASAGITTPSPGTPTTAIAPSLPSAPAQQSAVGVVPPDGSRRSEPRGAHERVVAPHRQRPPVLVFFRQHA